MNLAALFVVGGLVDLAIFTMPYGLVIAAGLAWLYFKG